MDNLQRILNIALLLNIQAKEISDNASNSILNMELKVQDRE